MSTNKTQAVAELRRRPRREEKLKAERVQEELKAMPGWKLAPRGKELTRFRQFGQPAGAARFASFVADMAVADRQRVQLRIDGNRVALTLQCRRGYGVLTTSVLEFARQLG